VVYAQFPSFSPSPAVPVSTGTFLPLEHADILITSGTVPTGFVSGLISQYFLYGPLYTHTALYLGGDSNGTPLIAEAVPPGEAGSFAQVRAVPLEKSTVWTESNIVTAFHPQVALPSSEKDAIVAWANGIISTVPAPTYWNPAVLALIPAADALSNASLVIMALRRNSTGFHNADHPLTHTLA
jgi:hypothetical protein